MFAGPNSLPPFDRSPTNGFRCVRYLGGKGFPELPARQIEFPLRDYSKERPVSDDIFRVYAGLYAYDPTELNAVVEKVDESSEDWKMEKITFNAAYGNERMMAYLYLRKKATPPFQTVALNRPIMRRNKTLKIHICDQAALFVLASFESVQGVEFYLELCLVARNLRFGRISDVSPAEKSQHRANLKGNST